jgi:hypothetical protein
LGVLNFTEFSGTIGSRLQVNNRKNPMRINIDKLESEKLLSDVDSSVQDKIIGGISVSASVDVSSNTDRALAIGGADVVIFGSKPFGSISVATVAGEKDGLSFSASSSFAFSTSG